MRIIALSTLRDFWEKHPQAKEPLQGWYFEAVRAEWKTPADIKAMYRNASFVDNNRVVFNIKGNDYRIESPRISRRPVGVSQAGMA
jgi:mRNA interferase HigB